MHLEEKMFSRSPKSCPVRSECGKGLEQKSLDKLFARDWEVFVIKRKELGAGFRWFTLCCEQPAGNA